MTALIACTILLTGIIVSRLFYLQVIKYDYYEAKAVKEHFGKSELPAHRGQIFIKDYSSNENVTIATNTTLDLLYADPTLIKDKKLVADRIAPLIFVLDEAKQQNIADNKIAIAKAKTPEEMNAIKALTDEELYKKFADDLLDKISKENRSQIILSSDLPTETLDQINNLHLTGIEVSDSDLIAYPGQISDRSSVARTLSPYLELPPTSLENLLKGQNRYVILKRKLRSEISVQIKKFIDEDKTGSFTGLGLKEEYFRYYPEGSLAANILGFVTPQGLGQYGIESSFNSQLQGKKGLFQTQKDSIGRQITVGDSIIQPAVDGDDIVLTIDRSVQMAVERMLARAVNDYRADNGQVIVMDPKTGNIIAMANYPTFDPNNYGTVFNTEPINLSANDIANLVPITGEDNAFWLYRDLITMDRIKIFKVKNDDGSFIYKKYSNIYGPEAYQNKAVSQTYEPGSVFKIITMSTAIDDGDVTPSTGFNDPGFLLLDKNPNGKWPGPDGQKYDANIKNVASKCTGHVTMTWVIQNSCNTGISWVAKKIGRNLFYSYMTKFGFNERTEIEFDNESVGKIDKNYEKWTDSELANHAFGQGITVTPIQMVTSYAAIANKGILMQPHIVDSIHQKDGKVIQTQPTPLQRVVSEQTTNTMKAMLINNVENGDSYSKMKLPDHFFGAKTGTAQTYKNGQALSGAGTTITNVVGFGPINDPKFVIFTKMDHPRTTEWADSTSGVLFHNVAQYLFNYYSIPPDKK